LCFALRACYFIVLVVIILDGFYAVGTFITCRWFPRKVAILRLLYYRLLYCYITVLCLCYSSYVIVLTVIVLVFIVLQHPRMFDIGTLCVRVLLSANRVVQQFNSSAFR